MRGTYSLGSGRIDMNFSFFGGGGDGVSTKVYMGRLRAEVRPLTLLYAFLIEKLPLSYSTFY